MSSPTISHGPRHTTIAYDRGDGEPPRVQGVMRRTGGDWQAVTHDRTRGGFSSRADAAAWYCVHASESALTRLSHFMA